jgi:hypothetical protein
MTQQTKSWFIREGFRTWLIAMTIGVLIVGTILTGWMVQRVDREMREVLLLEARLVERALNPNRIKALTGTVADLDNPDYIRLKEQLSLVRKGNKKYRFLYLMGRRAEGSLFFYIDSEPPESKDYSPPGQPYREAPEGYRRVFDTRENATVGPVSDRWGRWITALVPIIDPATGNLIAVMGMDIDARTWKTDLAANAALRRRYDDILRQQRVRNHVRLSEGGNRGKEELERLRFPGRPGRHADKTPAAKGKRRTAPEAIRIPVCR